MTQDFNFVDTNILIYASFPEIEKYYHRANMLLEMHDNLFISNQIILEYINVATNKKLFEKPLDIGAAFGNIDKYVTFIHIVEHQTVELSELKKYALKYNIGRGKIFDLNIYLTMKANAIYNIITFNANDFAYFDDIKIIA